MLKFESKKLEVDYKTAFQGDFITNGVGLYRIVVFGGRYALESMERGEILPARYNTIKELLDSKFMVGRDKIIKSENMKIIEI